MAAEDFTTRNLIKRAKGRYPQPYYGPEFPLRFRLEVDFAAGGSCSYAAQATLEDAVRVNLPRARQDAAERGQTIKDVYVVEYSPVLMLTLCEVDWKAD